MSDWVLGVLETLGYLGLVLVLIAENLFPPIPSEVVLPLAGFFVGQGSFGFVGAVVASTLGSVLGALALYAMGRHGGRPLVLRYGAWLRVTPELLDRADGWFARHGDAVVLWARMVPLARSVVSVPAGIVRMPLGRFIALTTLGSAAWNALLIGCGWALGANWERVSEVAGSYSDAVLVVLVLGAAVVGLYLLLRRGSASRPRLCRRLGWGLVGASPASLALCALAEPPLAVALYLFTLVGAPVGATIVRGARQEG
ncbi:DedA family protein [Rubrobacter tropicus]|uniref:DedA family protein n=1 Tax=Rubrobacter tropicus TaxID=2653851 RepID=A0A6G8Q6M1_9ACTN|nr:DedA family protein [Rubrobacter tropicus]QIN82106.1 DedA family protein [Rubrobacter tropicus]